MLVYIVNNKLVQVRDVYSFYNDSIGREFFLIVAVFQLPKYVERLLFMLPKYIEIIFVKLVS
jgi:hypothetical protein